MKFQEDIKLITKRKFSFSENKHIQIGTYGMIAIWTKFQQST